MGKHTESTQTRASDSTQARVVIGLALWLAGCSRAQSGESTAKPALEPHETTHEVATAAPTPSPVPSPPPAPPACQAQAEVHLMVSPARPRAGAPMRVLAVSDAPLAAELRVSSERGKPQPSVGATRHGGPPYFWVSEVQAPHTGTWNAELVQPACTGDEGKSSLRIGVLAPGGGGDTAFEKTQWPVHRWWNRSLENVYSAWIEHLFDGPEDEQLSWPAVYHVLRDRERNLLYDYLGGREDSGPKAPRLRPDCADLPYFLRAYFAWKLRLPFGFSDCSRGGADSPPTCSEEITTNESPDERADARKSKGATAVFEAFLRGKVADTVHSGSGRTRSTDEISDYYPVPISWDSLRPGTVYADPYGHVLLLTKRVAQTAERGGVLYAVDGQPDGTVARKRFWRGNFLYAKQPELGGPGFKRFRPFLRREGALARLTDAEIRRHKHYGDLSYDAAELDVDGFYDAMDDALSPAPRDARSAMLELIAALDEQVRTRVVSVENGRKWLASASAPAAMPEGPSIFETTGAWEDFATPSRDLRLLIALDVVSQFPRRVARRPQRYRLEQAGAAEALEAELRAVLTQELSTRKVQYTRSDGSSHSLTLAEVAQRGPALEMAYNLNDCVEHRWGAPAGSDEASTCRGQAPAEQRALMQSYRAWFSERKRPSRR